ELFAPALIRTTLVTTVLSACGYAAAFGALQVTPSQVILARTEIAEPRAKVQAIRENKTATPEEKKEVPALMKQAREAQENRKSNIQFWQEVGGLCGRIILALLVTLIPARKLIRLFLIPGILLF